MTDPATAYFFKKYYRNIIKWRFVVYNPDFRKIWPSKEEEETAHQKELEEKRIAHEKELEEAAAKEQEKSDDAYNASTGSYSGLYGQKPVDDQTQSTLDEILNASSSQCNIDSLVEAAKSGDVTLPPEQDEIIREANAIYERLLREAAEDEAKKQAEIDAVKQSMASNSKTTS